MKKTCAICDLDREYREVLTRYISKREGRRYNIVGFSMIESFEEFLSKDRPSVLIISEAFIEKMESMPIMEEAIPKDTYILTEENRKTGYKYPEIYKYQSAEGIMRTVYTSFGEEQSPFMEKISKCSVIGIYSPVNRCGKTRFAYELASKYARSSKTIVLTLDEYCGMECFVDDGNYYSISDLLYKYRTGSIDETFSDEKIKIVDGLSIICCAKSAEDVSKANVEDIVGCIKSIKDMGYKRVIIDVGNSIDAETAIDACDKIFVPFVPDEISLRKMSLWEEEMQRSEKMYFMEKCEKILITMEHEIEEIASRIATRKVRNV